MTAVYVTRSTAVSPARWMWDDVNVNLNLLRENRPRKYSTIAWCPWTAGWCGGISTPSAAHTAEQRPASEAFTAASNSVVVFMMAARSISAASRVFICGTPHRREDNGFNRGLLAEASLG